MTVSISEQSVDCDYKVLISFIFFSSFGRKRTTQIPMFLGGLFCALVSTINKDTTDKRKCGEVLYCHKIPYMVVVNTLPLSSFPEDVTDKYK